MIEIFYGDKTIIFTDSAPGETSLPGVSACKADEVCGIAKMLEKLENINTLYVISPDPQRAALGFRSMFVPVEAAGGVARDRSGRVLVIRRNGRCDLPKGHVEKGETPLLAAARETEEETGVGVAPDGELICATLHFYNMGGVWEMKHTWWFALAATGGELAPQRQEGITEAAWVERAEISRLAPECFPSVRKVLKETGLL